MKVLHISDSHQWSGGTAQLLLLADCLRKNGVENYIACPANGELFKRSVLKNFPLIDFSPKSKMDMREALKYSKIFKQFKFDVVHAHHPKAHNVALLAKLFSAHKPVLIVSRRVAYKLPNNILARWKYKTKLVDGYIAVCDYVKNMLIAYGIEENRVYTVYSGVDKNKFFKREKDIDFKKSLGLNKDDFIISLIGNYSMDKGQHILISALKILKDKKYKFKVIFAGGKTDSADLKELFKKNLPLEYGLFLGLRNDVDKILNITDISVNPSMKEALVGTLREAMSCGVASIASDVGGNSELLKDNINGYLIKPGDYEELSAKIENLIVDENLRKTFSENAVKAIDENFTVEKMAENTMKIYIKYCDRKRSQK
jgi:glycosyltransferase involved in cell wall biosynthesis